MKHRDANRLRSWWIGAILLFGLVAAEARPYPVVKETGATLGAFVPEGWQVMAEAGGDLNGDNKPDLAAIIQGPKEVWENRNCGADAGKQGRFFPYAAEQEEDIEKTIGGVEMQAAEPRILVVLLARDGGGYVKALQDNRIILRRREGGMFDPVSMDSLRIGRNSLYLSYYGGSAWRWGISAQFRLEKGGWRLIGYGRDSFHAVSEAKLEYDFNLLTGNLGIHSQDEHGKRPDCIPCIEGEVCPSVDECGNGYFRPQKKTVWKKVSKPAPLLLQDFYCLQHNNDILPLAGKKGE